METPTRPHGRPRVVVDDSAEPQTRAKPLGFIFVSGHSIPEESLTFSSVHLSETFLLHPAILAIPT